MPRIGLQSEVLLSLALVMVLATLVLAAVLVTHEEARLRAVLGRALWVEARAQLPAGPLTVPGTLWWRVGPGGTVAPGGGSGEPLDDASRALAERARAQRAALLQAGPPWESIRFAAPLGEAGEVAVARLSRAASAELRGARLWVAFGVLAADVLVFTAFGAYLLRRRVVRPLQRLAEATSAIAAGDLQARVAEQGTRETVELARAFNEMTGSLERRTSALEKAIADLRASNARLRRAQAGLDRAERLASVGRLAAGVAHEVGNPIAAILAFVDVVGRDPGLSEASRKHLARAGRQGERVRRILRQLLDFSRPSRGAPGPVDVAAAARETLALVRAQRRYANVEFGLEAAPSTPPAWADGAALAQILLNLVLNAADAALEQGEAPRVQLVVSPAPLVARAGEGPEAAQGRRRPDAVECRVCDNGPGIADDDRERIFDPFFTTKPAGQGTGLGLSNALRLAEQQEGSLELADPPAGYRASFQLRLRCAPAAAADPAPDPASACGVRSALQGPGLAPGAGRSPKDQA